jgi:hypothetical protein
MERVGTPRLPAAVGANRFTWDLALPGPWDANAQRSGRNGPTVVPGTYRARLTSGAWSATRPLVVRIDPRVARDGVTLADLRAQLQHEVRARDMVTDVNQLVARVTAERERLATVAGAADTLRLLDMLREKLVTPPVRYSRPGLQAQISYLYSMTLGGDQRVGRDALERYRVLRSELDARIAELRRITSTRTTTSR